MPYYDTIAEDIRRAKEILARGKPPAADKPDWMTDQQWERVAAHIYGADSYAAYKLLESFVKELEKEMTQSNRELLTRLAEWTPEDRPVQFTEAHNPYNEPGEPICVTQKELDEDAEAPFFTEAYLYNLLGKEDARTLLAFYEKIRTALAAP